jgi:hypothetical protein
MLRETMLNSAAHFGLKVDNARVRNGRGWMRTFLRIEVEDPAHLNPTIDIESQLSAVTLTQFYLPHNSWPEFLIYIDAKGSERILCCPKRRSR